MALWACGVMACAGTGVSADVPEAELSQNQKELRAQQLAFEKSNYAILVAQGILIGGGTAAGVAAAFCKGEKSDCVATVLAAFAVGATAGGYYAYSLAKKAEQWANMEVRLASLREDLVAETGRLDAYHTTLRQVIRDHEVQAQQLRTDVRLGKLSRAEAQRKQASARADFELTTKLLDAEQTRYTAMRDELKRAQNANYPQRSSPAAAAAAVEQERRALLTTLQGIVADQKKLEKELPI